MTTRGLHDTGRAATGDRDERGAVIMLVAILTTVMLIFASLVLDIGNASQERRQAQAAADAAALTGAQDFTSTADSQLTVVQKIKTSASNNYGLPASAWLNCSDQGHLSVTPDAANLDTCISLSLDSGGLPSNVRVVIPTRQVRTSFGAVAGLLGLDVTAAATALVNHTFVQAPCAFCAIGPDTDLQNGNISVVGGPAYFGGNVTCGSQTSVTAVTIEIATPHVASYCGGHMTPAPTSTASLGDPLGASSGFPAAPDYSSLTVGGTGGAGVSGGSCSSGTITSGIYGNISGCTLQPGLYVVTGQLSGNVTGVGVTVFFTCGTVSPVVPRPCTAGAGPPPGQSGGYVTIAGNTVMDLEACAPSLPATCLSGAVGGLVFWFDRNDNGNGGTVIKANGSPQLLVVGTVYAASGVVDVKGTPATIDATKCGAAFCSEFDVYGPAFSGQGTISTVYLSGQNYHPPTGMVQLSS
ncbi:MAG: pilus assembly protein TadG-related protein [Acidimicrobiales bacterium]